MTAGEQSGETQFRNPVPVSKFVASSIQSTSEVKEKNRNAFPEGIVPQVARASCGGALWWRSRPLERELERVVPKFLRLCLRL
jgi:hypothetical protein